MALEDSNSSKQGDHEKNLVASSSVLAAIFLTGMKLTVGLMTMSLGILSEAAHSALDLVAAAVTMVAVRVSGRPADREHNYGHGKVENLSALFETILLLVTCFWIIYEAVQRLFFKDVMVEASVWSFIIMAVSIVIDLSRSKALARVAKKYDSQALEADALHFSTDVWSSSVVIVGLFLVLISKTLQVPWLAKADAAAALGVAGIVTYVSVQLGKRTIEGLLDAVPAGLRDQLLRAVKLPGVLSVEKVRVRRSGPEAFVDITLTVSRDTPIEQADSIATAAESAVRAILPNADVVVHVDPVRSANEGLLSTVRVLAARHDLGAHGIRLYDVLGTRSLELHLEVDDSLSVEEAHSKASALEAAVRQAFPSIQKVVSHLEPVGDRSSSRKATPGDEEKILSALATLKDEKGRDLKTHAVEVNRVAGELAVSFHCQLEPSESISQAHSFTERLERTLRDSVPNLGRVVIHVEPTMTES
jgi:cation diffusion facilitator family transporter